MKKKSRDCVAHAVSYYIEQCPTPWHFEEYMQKRLQLDPSYQVSTLSNLPVLKKSDKYFFHKNGFGACIILPKEKIQRCQIFACHTDSPALKVKQRGISIKEGSTVVHCDLYGSPILASWIGIPLIITGKVWGTDRDGISREWLIPVEGIPAFLPHIAIHLNRGVNEDGLRLDKQDHLLPIVSTTGSISSFEELLSKSELSSITFHDLFVIPQLLPQIVDDALVSPRLDNLSSAWALFEAATEAVVRDDGTALFFFFCNHEEVGSESSEGAYSALIGDLFDMVLEDLPSRERLEIKSKSLVFSCDAAHAVHPALPEKHDPAHKVAIGKGPVVKLNSNQRYSTPPKRLAEVLSFLERKNSPYQLFTSRGDIPCGSTVGPIFASRLGIDTIDIGIPILGMHAAVELGSLNDATALQQLIAQIARYF